MYRKVIHVDRFFRFFPAIFAGPWFVEIQKFCYLGETLSMNSHVNNTCSNAFYYLYNIRRIRKYLSRRSTETLIHAFVSSRVDYCNSLLYGLPAYQLNKLQRVQNAAARLIFLESKYCHVRPLL